MKGDKQSMDRFWGIYNNYKDRVDSYISIHLENLVGPDLLKRASSHLILSGGKRIRPVLTLSITELLGGDVENALPAASAIEFLHNFTLIHDDIMDRDEFRRGVKTTHILFGESLAILAGDYLFSMVFGIIARNYSGEKARLLTKLLAEASENICIGQAMDINPDKYVRNEEEYLRMIYLKTASLIEAATASGAVLADRYDDIEMFRNFGNYIGVAFQIADDILGLIGDPKITGKPVGNDIRNGKRTLPVLYSLNRMSSGEREKFLNVFGDAEASDEEVSEAIKLVVDHGGVEYSRSLMRSYADKAIKILMSFDESETREFLINLVEFIVSRER